MTPEDANEFKLMLKAMGQSSYNKWSPDAALKFTVDTTNRAPNSVTVLPPEILGTGKRVFILENMYRMLEVAPDYFFVVLTFNDKEFDCCFDYRDILQVDMYGIDRAAFKETFSKPSAPPRGTSKTDGVTSSKYDEGNVIDFAAYRTKLLNKRRAEGRA